MGFGTRMVLCTTCLKKVQFSRDGSSVTEDTRTRREYCVHADRKREQMESRFYVVAASTEYLQPRIAGQQQMRNSSRYPEDSQAIKAPLHALSPPRLIFGLPPWLVRLLPGMRA